MSEEVKIDLVTVDKHGEFVLYLVEDGPWPEGDAEWETCLRRIQDHVLDAFDAVVDGGLAKKYPDSIGKSVRIQVDSPRGCPAQVDELIYKIDEFVHLAENEYGQGLLQSKYVSGLRVVTGHSLGRF